MLEVLDACARVFTFPMLDNGYVYLAATRLSVRGEPYATAVPYRSLRYPFRRLLGLEDAAFEDMPECTPEALASYDAVATT